LVRIVPEGGFMCRGQKAIGLVLYCEERGASSLLFQAALRPSPSTASRASNTSGCAFSISSSNTTENGCSRTRRVSSPSLKLSSRVAVPQAQDEAIEKILAALAGTRDGLGNPPATP
jgi:hypothetical protein